MHVVAMSAALAGTACSTVAGSRWATRPDQTVDCEVSLVAPTLDALTSVVTSGLAIEAFRTASGCGGDAAPACGLFALGGIVAGGVAIVTALTATSGYGDWHTCHGANHPQDVAARRRVAKAAELTNAALLASRIGDCARVSELGHVVNDLDPAFHETIFETEPEIRRCIAEFTEGAAHPHCFDIVDYATTMVCLPSKTACERARDLVPEAARTSACIEAHDAGAPVPTGLAAPEQRQ